MTGITEKADHAQQKRRRLGVAIATYKKFSEDKASNQAAMIAFWAFFSIFPLFLVFVTILGYVLPASTKTSVLTGVAQLFPLLNLKTVNGLSGDWWPLVVGGASALWSGTSVVKTVLYAFNNIWELPEKDRPNLLEKIWRSVLALALVGAGLVLTTMITGVATGSQSQLNVTWYYRIGGYAISLIADVVLFLIAYRILTSRKVSFRDVRPGALLSGIAFFILQSLSALVISRYLKSAQGTYGNFAVVITMLWWFYLQSQIMLLGAELNVVLRERLHPRSVFGGPETEADHRALDAYAKQQTYHEEQEVRTSIDGEPIEQRGRRSAS
ncbi:MAG: YihY/virulence factor BrkB family protein [Solirubrobacteraceae bacterium]